MKKMPVVLLAVVAALFFSLIEDTFAKPIDRFIGQIQTRKDFREVTGPEKKKYMLYHGDVLLMERDNKSGKVWILGKYYTDADIETVNPTECIISFQKTEISAPVTTFNINMNEEKIGICK